MDILRDDLWQFVGAAAGIVAAIGSAIWALRQRERSRLARAVRVSPLLMVSGSVRDDITVTFRNAKVESLKLFEVSLVNTGNRPTRREDFDGPVRVSFGPGAVVMDSRIAASQPLDLPVELEGGVGEAASVTVAPLLLNPGDGFTIASTVSGKASADVSCRVAGVAELDRVRPWVRPLSSTIIWGTVATGAFFAAAIGLLGYLAATQPGAGWGTGLSLAAGLATGVFTGAFSSKAWWERRSQPWLDLPRRESV